MDKLQRDDLYSLEAYSAERTTFREKVMAHKRDRRLVLGEHVLLLFEDRLTMQYQVQEMLRAERIFEAAGIQEELDSYNPLIPDGNNWKATMMIEYADAEERRVALQQLAGIEDRVWMQVSGHEPVYAIADEDLERGTEEKTSAVHFLRFELTAGMCRAAREGAALRAGVDHKAYTFEADLTEPMRESLVADLA